MRYTLLLFLLLVALPLGAQDTKPQDPPIPPDQGPVHKLAHGIAYSVQKRGEGKLLVHAGDEVTVNYTGWLPDGKVFDSSARRKKPATFKLAPGAVILGWVEVLPLMHVGDVFKMTIPPAMAYGKRYHPGIPPDSTLIFKVEMLKTRHLFTLPMFHKAQLDQQQKTPSGLIWEVVKPGRGSPAKPAEKVEIQYAIWATDGTLLECSEVRSQSLVVSAQQIRLPLLKEALPLIKPGGRLRFTAPSELTFGARQQYALLPPNSTTIWEIEVVKKIEPLKPPAFSLIPAGKGQKTASGLVWQVLKEGQGPHPGATDRVKVHYAGWLTSGKLFDSSFTRGLPATFGLNQVIKGWTEGLQLMSKGAIYRFVIPYQLAYGANGRPPTIPAKSDLVFYVQLLDIIGK